MRKLLFIFLIFGMIFVSCEHPSSIQDFNDYKKNIKIRVKFLDKEDNTEFDMSSSEPHNFSYDSESEKFSKKIEVKDLSPEKYGYTFKEWQWRKKGDEEVVSISSSQEGEIKIELTFDEIKKYLHDDDGYTLTLYALWRPLPKVTLKPNGGNWNGNTNDFVYNANYYGFQTISFDKSLKYEGYVLKGWSKTENGEVLYYANSNSSLSIDIQEEELILYAVWVANSLDIDITLPSYDEITVNASGGTMLSDGRYSIGGSDYLWFSVSNSDYSISSIYVDGVCQSSNPVSASSLTAGLHEVVVCVQKNNDYYSKVFTVEVSK